MYWYMALVTTLIDFGRPPQWNCPIPESDATISDSENSESYEANTFSTSEPYKVQTETSVKTSVRTRVSRLSSRCAVFER